MEAFGLKAQSFAFPADITDGDFKREFARINGDPAVDGILLLRPLPKQICEADIERMIDPRKDLDGISPENIAKVFAGDGTGYAPCTAEAVMEILKANDIDGDRKAGDHRRPQPGGGKTAGHADDESERHGHRLPHQDEGAGGDLP